MQILVGTNDLGKGGKYYKVEKLIAHENYNNPSFAYDIAVIRIQGKIEFNERVQPIEYSPDEVPDEADVQLTGWGRLQVIRQVSFSASVFLAVASNENISMVKMIVRSQKRQKGNLLTKFSPTNEPTEYFIELFSIIS